MLNPEDKFNKNWFAKPNNIYHIKAFAYLCYFAALWQFVFGVYLLSIKNPQLEDYEYVEYFFDTFVFLTIGLLTQFLKSRVASTIITVIVLVNSAVIFYLQHLVQRKGLEQLDIINTYVFTCVMFVLSIDAVVAIYRYRKDKDYFDKRRNKYDRTNS